MSCTEFQQVSKCFIEFYRDFTGFYRVLLGLIGFCCFFCRFLLLFLGFTECYWVLLGFTGFSRGVSAEMWNDTRQKMLKTIPNDGSTRGRLPVLLRLSKITKPNQTKPNHHHHQQQQWNFLSKREWERERENGNRKIEDRWLGKKIAIRLHSSNKRPLMKWWIIIYLIGRSLSTLIFIPFLLISFVVRKAKRTGISISSKRVEFTLFFNSSLISIGLGFTGLIVFFLHLPIVYEFYQILPSFTKFYQVLPGFTGFYRVLPSFTGFYRVLPGFTGFYRVLTGFWLGFTGFYRVLAGFTGFYRVLPGFTGFWLGFTGFWLGFDRVKPSFTCFT